MDLSELEKTINIDFANKNLLKTAFAHRSYLNEHADFHLPSNERLEFLGDAILQSLTSEFLYKTYPRSSEGELTNYRAALVCTQSLAESAKKLDLGKYLYLSKGENDSGGRESAYLLANTFEALLGAIYLDMGFDTAREFLENNLFIKLPEIIKNKRFKDFKSTLQEIVQEKLLVTPVYRVLREWGPDHNKSFEVAVLIKDKIVGKGAGSSKQKAEQTAAKDSLEKLDEFI